MHYRNYLYTFLNEFPLLGSLLQKFPLERSFMEDNSAQQQPLFFLRLYNPKAFVWSGISSEREEQLTFRMFGDEEREFILLS